VTNASFFFAGGGTGGHIYPALAVAEQIIQQRPDAKIHFLTSTRPVDKRILDRTPFPYTPLPATGLFFHPVRLLRFWRTFWQSRAQAQALIAAAPNPVVIGAGGFVAAPACLAGHQLGIPVALINVDITPGRANKLSARWANDIFVQFEEAGQAFNTRRAQIHVTGCPLRSGFTNPDPNRAIVDLNLDKTKKTLLITGASSGAASINEGVCALLNKLDRYADTWQIVHLTGLPHHDKVQTQYKGTKIAHTVVSYYDNMPDLLAAADLCIGRSGAVSVAEYAVAGLPTICMPYPHHKDRHQYRNAAQFVQVGAAIIVDDLPDPTDRAEWLWEELEKLMTDDPTRQKMATATKQAAHPQAANKIATHLLTLTTAEAS